MKLLVLGNSNGSIDIVKYAKRIGVYTIVADYYPLEYSMAKQIADEHWEISTADVDLLEAKCLEVGVDAVVCGCSEFNIERVLDLTERLKLPFYCDRGSWHYSRDKCDFKNVCKELGIRVPKDYFISGGVLDITSKINYPVVVKPVDQCSNRGVSFCNNEKEILDAVKVVKSFSSSQNMIVEQMIKGEEWYAYYALADGEARFIALNAMYYEPGYPSNCYSITTTATNYINKYIKEMNTQIKQLLKRVGCKEGIAWVQIMLNEDDNKFYAIEMGYRLDGDMMFVPYKELIGFDSIKWLVDCSLWGGNAKTDLPNEPLGAYDKCACSYMVWTKMEGTISQIDGLDRIESMDGIQVAFHAGIGDHFDAYRPLGNILFTSKDVDEMINTIISINNLLSIRDSYENELMIKYTDFHKLRRVYREGFVKAL